MEELQLPFKLIIQRSLTLLLLAFMASVSHAQGVVSTSLCADAYVLALSRPDEIKALSWQADSPLSLAPLSLRSRQGGRADAETLLLLQGSKVVFGPADNTSSLDLASQRGSSGFRLAWVNDFEGIEQNLRDLAVFLDRPQAVESIIQIQQKALQNLRKDHSETTQKFSVLYVTPTLGTAGSDTFIDAAIKAAGASNFATELGLSGWGQLRLEQLLTSKPDLLVTSFFKNGPHSANNFRAAHPIVQNLRKTTPEVHIDGGLWVCAGPNLLKASRQIANALPKQQKP